MMEGERPLDRTMEIDGYRGDGSVQAGEAFFDTPGDRSQIEGEASLSRFHVHDRQPWFCIWLAMIIWPLVWLLIRSLIRSACPEPTYTVVHSFPAIFLVII